MSEYWRILARLGGFMALACVIAWLLALAAEWLDSLGLPTFGAACILLAVIFLLVALVLAALGVGR